jgi:gluconate 2-dehydrogenase gamma chain
MPGIASFGWEGPPRRAVITGIPAAAVVIGLAGCTSAPPRVGPVPTRFFSPHQAAVVADATARIAPGPADDPAEAGHPGARETGVTGYIDAMLGALTVIEADDAAHATAVPPVPVIFAGGPWSGRHAPGPDPMASFIALDPVSRIAWRKRLAGWRGQYASGIAALDKMAGGDFTKASAAEQDKILASAPMKAFLALLFEHTIEGMYANPEYGGNRGLAGWKDIGYPGDSQPAGYTGDEVERSDGLDPLAETAVVADVLKLLGAL